MVYGPRQVIQMLDYMKGSNDSIRLFRWYLVNFPNYHICACFARGFRGGHGYLRSQCSPPFSLHDAWNHSAAATDIEHRSLGALQALKVADATLAKPRDGALH
ncbi:MAG: hypothetical protein AMXMBFR7_51620 [Planctomycetota bacterium]